MTGLEKRVARLFANKGKLFVAAFDHPQIYGTMQGLENTPKLVKSLQSTGLDGFILNPGMVGHIETQSYADKLLVLRASVGGTMIGDNYQSYDNDLHQSIASAELAARLGADAALFMFVLNGKRDKECQLELARVCEDYHRLGIPVIAEVLNADYTMNNDTTFIASGARITAEIGADVIKAFYCPEFDRVTSNCPVPVILAGGPKDADITAVVKEVVSKGAKGLAFGRNLFQADDIKGLVRDLNRALRS
jgi:class I fructose-bisphosphate aldolase/fructose-bisphosphate aldolase/2-amino-3,7-dideoxy-D-threo-hept-6-ulosonate synthase